MPKISIGFAHYPGRLLFCTLLAMCGLLSGSALAASTDPVGFVTLNIPADSDTYVSLPLKRASEFEGVASAVAGNKITLLNTGNLTPSQFVYTPGTQTKHYYVFLGGGLKAGAFYTITANDASSITVDLAGDSLEGALTLGAGGTKLQIIPYDTLGTIFPAGAGVVASTEHSFQKRETQILIPDQETAGTNLPAASIYYYYSGPVTPGVGWRKDGTMNKIEDDQILYPDNFFIIRTKPGQASTLTLRGGVPMATLQVPLSTRQPNLSQDNAVALSVASDLTLRQTNLFESGAFIGSPSHGFAVRQDQLLVFDNTVIGHNKAAGKIYYYFTGTNPGWRLDGDMRTNRDNEVVVTPNTAIVVRKKGKPAAGTLFWSVKPPYVP